MEAFRGIKCSSFWDALVLRLMLEEHGVRVHVPDQGVVLSMVASGKLDGIRAAVEQLGNEFPRSGSVIIEGEDRDRSAENGRATALSYDIAEEARAAHRAQAQEARRPPSGAARRQDAPGPPGDTAQRQDARPRAGDTAQPREALRPSAGAAQPQDAAQPPSGAAQPQDAVRRLDDPDTDEVAAITAQLAEEAPVAEPAQPQAEPRRCSASTAKGPRCRLIAQPGSTTCAVHSRHALPASHPLRPMRSPTCHVGRSVEIVAHYALLDRHAGLPKRRGNAERRPARYL